MPEMLSKLDLAFNPFEPAASGPPVGIAISPPELLADRLNNFVKTRRHARGPKVLVILGDYGTGKTCLLQWLHDHLLPGQRIKPFYFDNPGVHFYDLANTLLRTIGRKDFATFIWEFAGPHLSTPGQRNLFRQSFDEYLSAQSQRQRGRQEVVAPLQAAILSSGVTSDEEIAHCLARIVTDAARKPYFEYRDYLSSKTDDLNAEPTKAPYFRAILTTLARGFGAAAIAFLIDEFEETGLQKRLTKRVANDYLSTLRRLIYLARQRDDPFWLFLSMTPDGYRTTKELEPALVERLETDDSVLRIEPLQARDTLPLLQSRLHAARPRNSTSGGNGNGRALFPFPDDVPFSPDTRSNPRRLVKACSAAISAARDDTPLPFSSDYLKEVEDRLFASETDAASDGPRS